MSLWNYPVSNVINIKTRYLYMKRKHVIVSTSASPILARQTGVLLTIIYIEKKLKEQSALLIAQTLPGRAFTPAAAQRR
jgi:hypothetical protein